MKTLSNNLVLRATHKRFELGGQLIRILYSSEESDEVVLIRIPEPTQFRPVNYYPSPDRYSWYRVQEWLNSGDLVETTFSPPALAAMSDEAIRAKFPMRCSGTKRKQRVDSAPLQARDEDYMLIDPMVEEIQANPREFFLSNRYSQWIKARAAETGKGQARIRNSINKFLAVACGKNGLLSGHNRCGAEGQARSHRCGKLGRRSRAAKLGLVANPGIPLSENDKEHIAWGWRTFLRDGQSVPDAYLLTMGVLYSDGEKVHQGRNVPVLKPVTQRPTLSQFRYWGPRGEGAKSAWETLLKPGEWEKKFRAMQGTARDGIQAVGQVAFGDSTSNDVHLVSLASYLKSIGTGTVARFHDGYSDCIVGVELTLAAPSEELALKAILNTVTDKVALCKRFGIDITPEMFPSGFYRLYHYDNGEPRANYSMQCMKNMGSNLEFVQVGRADLKPMSESGHRRVHKKLDHKIAGTTRGRQRQRGEEAAATSASWTFWCYMRELLLAIIHHNSVAPADHLMTVEMRRDGVANNRAAIHQWAVKKGYVSYLPCNESHLRAHLLQAMKAVVRPNGIFLLRPDRGDKREIVRCARFIGQRATQLKWLEQARRDGVFDIEVRVDENDLSRVWYLDTHGIHELINVAPDPVLIKEGTLTDLLRIQDDDQLQKVLDQADQEQEDSDFVAGRYAQDQKNRKAKRDAIKQTGRKVPKSELQSNIKQNRADEIKLMGDASGWNAPEKMADVVEEPPEDFHTPEPNQTPGPVPVDPLESELDEFFAEEV